MNKNNFMKAMSMIDEDLIQDANTQNTAESPSVSAETDYNGKEPEIVVSGVDVYHRTVWKKILAVAATLVVVTGAAGGGAYYFSQLGNNNNIIEKKDESDIASLFEEIYKSRDSYDMIRYGRSESDDGLYYEGLDDNVKEEVFRMFDKIILNSDIEKTDQQGSDESIQFLLYNRGEESFDNYLYKFEVYSNGVLELSEKQTTDTEKTYRCKLDDISLYNTFMRVNNEMFKGNNNETIGTESIVAVDAPIEEIAEFLNNIFETGSDKGSYQSYQQPKCGCIITNKERLVKELLQFKWSKRTNVTNEYYFSDQYFDIGIRIDDNCNIYDANKTPYTVYSLDLDYRNELEDILRENTEMVFDRQDVPEQKITDLLGTSSSALLCEGSIDNCLTYDINDLEGLKNEIASLGWVTCTDFECNWGPSVSDAASLRTDKSGYIIGNAMLAPEGNLLGNTMNTTNDEKLYCTLKNKDDAVKLQNILDKYVEPNRFAKMCIKLQNGMNSFNTLKAHYTYEVTSQDEYQRLSLSGELLRAADQQLLYMTGEGKYYGEGTVELELAERLSENEYGLTSGIIKVTEKDTGATRLLTGYTNSGQSLSRPGFEYDDIINKIRVQFGKYYDSDSPIFMENSPVNVLAFDISDINGNTEYYIHTRTDSDGYSDEKEYRILMDENGRLISYQMDYKGTNGDHTELFRLDDHEFDSPDFSMNDAAVRYESLEAELEEQNNNAGQ